ncbi:MULTISPECIES: hypothetical protein [Paraburkholderia]|uniref:hypothetical protein n=1 Tax=Paraburkholderia TaxID=1822464 RepID=UPI002256F12A|nr:MULTISPECIES: hypothetical protein [Paraburkholderia]MCX4170692.1 hypothetical protein [Paraburkholderia madseniana]MDQ6458704.1 hypothetical protein [Paraburkholderia madseniana]
MDQLEYSPIDFADQEFAKECAPCFDYFIEQLVKGIPRDIAIIDAFQMIRKNVSLFNAHELGLAAECNPYVKDRLDVALAEKKASALWNTNKSINRMLKIVENPREKGQTKIAAMKELNVLVGITVVDENGQTRAGRSLEDFYAEAPKNNAHAATVESVTNPKPREPTKEPAKLH